MVVTIEWIRNKYEKFNKMYFKDQLPTDLVFKISRSKDTWGSAAYHIDYKKNTITPTYIAISNYYDSPEFIKENTLLHEMIHVLDYVTHPEHYVIKHSPNRYYNAHGKWFLNECKRFLEFGYDIQKNITKEEEQCSTLSKSASFNLERKKQSTIVCAVVGSDNKVWFCKTNIENTNKVLKLIKKHENWFLTFIGFVREVKVYKTESEKYAEMNSCKTRLTGWVNSVDEFENEAKKNNFELLKKKMI